MNKLLFFEKKIKVSETIHWTIFSMNILNKHKPIEIMSFDVIVCMNNTFCMHNEF